MWTRHLTKVILDWKDKLSQYGQWDGYPDWQWVEILSVLKSMDLNILKDKISECEFIPGRVIERIWNLSKEAGKNYPSEFHRDTGGAWVLQMVYKGEVKSLSKDDGEWCEWFYTIDFDNNKFITQFHWYEVEYPLDNLPSKEEYLKEYKDYEENED